MRKNPAATSNMGDARRALIEISLTKVAREQTRATFRIEPNFCRKKLRKRYGAQTRRIGFGCYAIPFRGCSTSLAISDEDIAKGGVRATIHCW